MKRFLKGFWAIFRSNLALKIAAILFAVILWSYVLSVVNPLRERVIKDVPVTWQNVESLEAKNLAVSGKLSDILNTVNIRVRVKQNEQKLLNNQSAQAYIDLSSVNGPGTYTLKVAVDPKYGQLVEVEPSQIDLHIYYYRTRQIPVEVVPKGAVSAGYYADAPVINPGIINISGAEPDVQKVVSARCTVKLDGLTKGYNQSSEVDLLDASGNTVDPGLFTSTLPTVIVDLSVLPVKEVDVDVQGSIIGQDSLAAGFEITGITCNPSKVRIVGDKTLLDGISSIKMLPFSVSGANSDVFTLAQFAPPEGIRILDVDKAEVTVNIRETTNQKTFKSVAIKTKNLASGLTAAIAPSSVDVTVLAGISKLSTLLRSDIVPYVDLDGLTAGTYSLNVLFEIPRGFAAENFTPSFLTVNVTIRKK